MSYEQDFVRFLSKEYGLGGRGGPDGIDEMHDGKGIRFSKKNKETGETIAVSLKWEQAAVKIANLIDEDNYLNEEEAKEYATLVRFRNERKSANGDDELVKIMARQIVEYGTAHTYSEKYSDYPGFLDEGLQFYAQHAEEIIKEVEKYDEVISAANTNYPYLSISFKLPYCTVWQAREERIRQREEKVKDYRQVEEELDEVIELLHRKYGFIDYNVGRNGEFDELATQAVRRFRREWEEWCELTLVEPYPVANLDIIEKSYDSVIIPTDRKCHFKAAIGERNKWLAENCDMMIVYIKRDYGGAYKCYKHAQELGVPIMNIADNIKNQEW